MVVGLKSALIQIVENGVLNDDDILNLRKIVFADYKIDDEEANLLIEIDIHAKNTKPHWNEFFSEVIFDYVVFDIDGARQTNQTRLKSLVAKFTDVYGRIAKLSHLNILVKIASAIESGAQDLNNLILSEIEKSVQSGVGATKSLSDTSNSINDIEISIIRQIIHDIGGEGGTTISTHEVQFIQRIKDMVVLGHAADGFSDLYVKVIANHFRAHNFDSNNFVANYTYSEFFDSLRAGVMGEFRNVWNDAHSQDVVAAKENFDATEKAVFDNMINSDGKIDEYEAKAIEYLKSI